ncbi:hypothetical protein C5167_003291 [Papaver somniferum]|uniref:Uncharacterized protein n=1 Tax=Papaver somniferum TaxID=3469 RepID=A0A4Y7L3Z0_PAPSO|nr:uncharacterized protein LOC113313704 [Papaver somniferum]RZC79081.1 hypothetical protein C5167_003291 [Papaver somniferum]
MALATHLSAPPSSKSFLRFHRSISKPEISPTPVCRIGGNISSTHLSFRVDNVTRWMKKRRTPILFAQPSEGGDIVKEKSEGNDTSGNKGPPILTILAGFLVLLLVFWVLGSIATWLISLIVTVAPSK